MTGTRKDLIREENGGATLEFGLVVPLFVLMLISVMEMGMLFFANTALEGGLREAARYAITGRTDGASREQAIINIINKNGYGIVKVTADNITTEIYQDFADIDTAEPIVGDEGEIGVYEPGIDDGYTDINCNGTWDEDIAKSPGAGGGNDVVIYVVDYQHEFMTNLLAPMIGGDGKVPLTARVAVRNEPFGNSDLCLDSEAT